MAKWQLTYLVVEFVDLGQECQVGSAVELSSRWRAITDIEEVRHNTSVGGPVVASLLKCSEGRGRHSAHNLIGSRSGALSWCERASDTRVRGGIDVGSGLGIDSRNRTDLWARNGRGGLWHWIRSPSGQPAVPRNARG